MVNATSLRSHSFTALMLALGGAGGALAQRAGLPMPWMLGALMATGLFARFAPASYFESYGFPTRFRIFFVALIGVMIGTQVTPDLLAMAPDLALTLGALVVFVPMAHLFNMAVFRRIGGYDRVTAFYAATPGGLMESITMGDAAGADIQRLTVQQFLRIVVVITLLPLGLSLWTGQAVGSAAGMALPGQDTPVPPLSLVLIAAAAVLGLSAGTRIGLPAAQLTGPLLIAAFATVTGVLDLHLPVWLIAVAQVVIGTSLGLRFQGVEGALLRRSVGLSALSVSGMLLIGAGFAAALSHVTGIAWLHLFIAFAPGGVAEMSLVALSLAASPALVSLHHVVRILITVVEMPLTARRLGLRAQDRAPAKRG
ncbi:AbrB family transcriptional regulator [Sagittula sp. SSi028]|uniref:AbrB family transcriptional regulator n=1 Tax=Sagittula sp. SSi028 TaxID=3400636 RepID=UPI003AF83FA5